VECILFTTSDLLRDRATSLHRLLRRLSKEAVPPRHYVLLQGISENSVRDFIRFQDTSATTVVLHHPHRIGLSKARNIMLQRAAREGAFEDPAIVGFPDDDAAYPPNFLDWLRDTFARTPDLDLLLCGCAPEPVAAEGQRARAAACRDVVRRSTSNTVFLRSTLVARAGYFDENLGLGTPAQGGEDTEYMLRAFQFARCSACIDAPLVEHPEATRETASRYYHGALTAIAWHAPYTPACAIELARKAAIGGVHVLRGRMSSAVLTASYCAAASALAASVHAGRGRQRSRDLQLDR
jgi:hypothetical protein